jgi:CRISPR/Cas system-associated exonuclease Cas4 (RecB family)
MPLTSIAELNGPPEEVTRRINQAKRLSALYDTYVNMMQDGHDRVPGIHASELYPCMRQAVYSVRAEPRQPKVSKFWKQRFKMGSRIHLMLQDDFEGLSKASAEHEMFQYAQRVAEDMDCRIEFDREVKVSPELQPIAAYWNIHSACDGIFRFYDRATNELVLRIGLEIKTEAPAGYEALKEPKPEHVRQAHLYMGCLDIPILWFLYMNKGNQNNTNSQAPYLVVYQPSIWAELEGRFREVHGHVQQQTLPPRVEGVYCEFCAWAYTCKPDNSRVHSQGNYQPRVNVRAPGQV